MTAKPNPHIASLLASCLLIGCVSLPRLHDVGGPSVEPPGAPKAPTTSQIIAHIECEIWTAFIDEGWPNDHERADLKPLRDDDYVAVVDITLDETVNKGFTPSLSYINPFSTPSTNFTFSVSPEITGEGHRTFNQTFTIHLDPKAAANECTNCEKARGDGIKGNLGIEQILIEGLRHRIRTDFYFPLVTANSPASEQNLGIGGSPVLTFGSTIDFTIVYGLANGGPNWTLTHFTGIGTPLNYTRTRKDTVILSFASSGP